MKSCNTKKDFAMSGLRFWGWVLSVFMLCACDSENIQEKADPSKFSFTILRSSAKVIPIVAIKQQLKTEPGWTIKSITIDDTYKSFAEVQGTLKDLKITLKRPGFFTASITLEKAGYEDFVLKGCKFEVAVKVFMFTFKKLTQPIKKPHTITSEQILGQITGDNKIGWTIKSIEVSDAALAKVSGTAPKLQIDIKKGGNFTATIVLANPGYFDTTLRKCAFEIFSPAPVLSFPSYEKLNNDKNNAIITGAKILAHIPEAEKNGYTLKALTGLSADSTIAALSGTKQIIIKKEDSPFTATIILEKSGYQDVVLKGKSFSYINIFTLVGKELKGYKEDKYKTSITKLNIPEVIGGVKITSVGTSAFKDCKALTSVTLPNSVIAIKSSAFYKCTSLTNATLPSVTSIAKSAFSGCTSLTSVTLPAVISIGSNIFYKCTALKAITIPDSATSIGSSAFSGCVSLAAVMIGNKVASIRDYAFNNCKTLTSLTLPSSVTAIGKKTFSACTKLVVTIQQTKPASITLGTETFSDIKTIEVPKAVLDSYKKASGWSTYASKIVGY